MAMAQRKDPFRNFRFRVEIDGIQQAGFSDVSGFDSTIQVVEYREGTDPVTPRKLAGSVSTGSLVLKWGITDSLDLYNWHKEAAAGNVQRKNVSIIIIDEAGNDKARWDFANAWPSKYSAPELSAKGNDIAVESVTLEYENMTRVS